MKSMHTEPTHTDTILVVGGNGKTGRRVVDGLRAKNKTVRIGSRNGQPPFQWEDRSTWPALLSGVSSVYLTYTPDLAVPGAPDDIQAFTDLAVQAGVTHIVLLSGRGEAEAQRCEAIVQASGVDWTLVRASWFNQNFSEGAFVEMVLAGDIVLPAGLVGEPFIDTEDIAAVAVAALTEAGHTGQIYEVTGPRLLTFADAAKEITRASGRPVVFTQISREDFAAAMLELGVPAAEIDLMDYLFTTVLDGRNAHITDGVQRALGRPPIDFADYARKAAAAGLWQEPALAVG